MSSFVRRLAGVPWRSIAGDALSRVFLVAQAYCVVHIVNQHLCSLAIVRGSSMLPALNLAGDVVAVDRVSVRLGRVAPGDVVLMISPEDPRKSVAKRVVGMEGDSVTYLVDPGNSDASKTVVVPQGHVWCRAIIFMLLRIQGNLELFLMASLRGRSFAGFGRWRALVQLIQTSLNRDGPILLLVPRDLITNCRAL